jgi:hypothetical protein
MQALQVQVRGTAAIVLPLLIACNNLKQHATVALRDDRGCPRAQVFAEGFDPARDGGLGRAGAEYVL